MIAFLGMGLLGSNFVKALLRNGEQVRVWNRTYSRAQQLEADGALVFENITEAVRGADRIHLTLKDDAAVNEVLELARTGLKPGTRIIDHTTTSAAGALERTEKWKAAGFTYMHVPVFMGPQNALESTGSMLVSGDQALIAEMEPILSKMTGKVINFGTEVERAAGMKLIGNLFLISMTGGLNDVLALAKAQEIPMTDVFSLFDAWNPTALVPVRLTKMTNDTFNKPSWELNMARKDARLMMEITEEKGVPLHVIPAIAAEMDKWIEKGHGSDDWTVIAKENAQR